MRPQFAERQTNPLPWRRPAEPVTSPRSFRRSITDQLNAWVKQYSLLVGKAIDAAPDRRATLSRELLQLAERRDRVRQLLDDLATATGDRQWEESRRRVETAWREVETLTSRLVRRLGT